MPKSTTLDDLQGPLRTLFQNTCVLRSPLYEKLNEDRPSDEDVAQWSRYWQYKVYVDIRGSSQDLCKFSLDFCLRPCITYTGMVSRSRFQVQVFGL